jgi:polysaccharide export outer membrane protein
MIKKTIVFLSIVIVFMHAGCTSFDKIQDNINQITNKNIENRLEAINGTYKLSPPDVIEIDVNDNPELRTRAIIRPDGNIFFPLLGDIYIEGLTPLEIREKIHKLLGRYLKELPEESVSVSVLGFNSKKVYIYSYGYGIKEIPFTGDLTVLDAITKSGLLARTSDRRGIKIIRGESDSVKKPQKLVVNLNDIINKGRTERNIVLRPNDIVYIPPTLLGRIGFAAQDILSPTRPAQELGGVAASAQYNALGFGGIRTTGVR